MKDWKIIICSDQRTGSTVLTNVIYGLLFPDEPVGTSQKDYQRKIIKTHKTNIDWWVSKFGEEFDLYFACAERKDVGFPIEEKYRDYTNVKIFQFEELNQTPECDIKNIVANVYYKLKPFLDKTGNLLYEEKAEERIKNMNKFYETVKHKPFSYYDDFYGIHGNHRNRTSKSYDKQ